jgi:hypothetical protein
LKIVARGAGFSSSAACGEFAISRFAVERVFEESDAQSGGSSTTQGKLLGLAVIMVVCGSFWGAVGLAVTHFLK